MKILFILILSLNFLLLLCIINLYNKIEKENDKNDLKRYLIAYISKTKDSLEIEIINGHSQKEVIKYFDEKNKECIIISISQLEKNEDESL